MNENAATPSVAEGPAFFALIAVSKAYSVTDAPSLSGRMLHTRLWPARLAVIGSLLATVAAMKWRSDFGGQAAAFLVVLCFYCSSATPSGHAVPGNG